MISIRYVSSLPPSSQKRAIPHYLPADADAKIVMIKGDARMSDETSAGTGVDGNRNQPKLKRIQRKKKKLGPVVPSSSRWEETQNKGFNSTISFNLFPVTPLSKRLLSSR